MLTPDLKENVKTNVKQNGVGLVKQEEVSVEATTIQFKITI